MRCGDEHTPADILLTEGFNVRSDNQSPETMGSIIHHPEVSYNIAHLGVHGIPTIFERPEQSRQMNRKRLKSEVP